ncbi:MAG: hypothetical protein R3A44_06235 [Caldilineaceae bacterium]
MQWVLITAWRHLVRHLVIDNDHKYRDAFEPDEFIAWEEIPLGDFIRAKLANPDQFPGLDRFGDLRSRLEDIQPIEVISNGFRGNRGIGAMGYEFMATMHGDQMVAELLKPALELYGVSPAGHLYSNGQAILGDTVDSDGGSQLIISQTFSSGGAKGSTSAFFNAWLLRAKLQELGITNVRFDCTIYFPEAFSASRQQQKRNQAHTEALLREFKAVYTQQLSPMAIGRHQVARTPVYTLIKLMNGVDQSGQRVYSQSDVYDIGAATAMLSSFGPIADHFESLIPNIVDDLSWPYVGYSQNCHMLVIPVVELQTQFGYQLTHQVVNDHLLRPAHHIDAPLQGKKRAREWMTRQHLTPQNLVRLLTEETGLKLVVDLTPFQKLPLSQMQKAVVEYEKAKFTLWERQLNKVTAQKGEALANALRQELSSLLNAPDAGLRTATYFLDHDPDRDIVGLSAFLADLKSMLTKRQIQTQTGLGQVRQQLGARPPLWQRMIPSWLTKSKQRRWFRLKQRELSLRVMEMLLRAQISLIERLQEEVQAHSGQVASWIAQLEQTSHQINLQASAYQRQRQQRPVYETNVLSQTEEAQLFEECQVAVFTLMGQVLRWQWHQDGKDSSSAGWAIQVADKTHLQPADCANPERLAQLCAYGRGFFADLEQLEIEQILADQGRDPVEVVESLKSQSQPLISVNLVADHVQQGSKSPGLRQEVILGSAQGNKGFFRSVRNGAGFQIVPTGQTHRHQIALLFSLFNINPFALAQSGVYAQSYAELKQAGHALHIFAEDEVCEQPPARKTRRTRRTKHVEQ